MGLIRNSDKVKQAIEFSGFEWGKIHPSDIDCVLEFDNEVLILIEVKTKGVDIPIGQRLLLQRICDSWHGKSIAIKAEHECEHGDIPLKDCIVTEVYFNRWVKKYIPLSDALKSLAINWNIKKML